jgi:hypothetical protein
MNVIASLSVVLVSLIFLLSIENSTRYTPGILRLIISELVYLHFPWWKGEIED